MCILKGTVFKDIPKPWYFFVVIHGCSLRNTDMGWIELEWVAQTNQSWSAIGTVLEWLKAKHTPFIFTISRLIILPNISWKSLALPSWLAIGYFSNPPALTKQSGRTTRMLTIWLELHALGLWAMSCSWSAKAVKNWLPNGVWKEQNICCKSPGVIPWPASGHHRYFSALRNH